MTVMRGRTIFLSIIDLEGGWQPIHNEDQTVWIVSNGEIFIRGA